MEKQLAEYRAQKAKEASQQKWPIYKTLFSSKNTNNKHQKFPATSSKNVDFNDSENYVHLYPRLRSFLWIILWCCCFGFFVQLGFGSVYFILSLFYFMYISMKSGTRRSWEPSAYSVFNENCEAIDGTLSGEQFDKELKFGAGSVGR